MLSNLCLKWILLQAKLLNFEMFFMFTLGIKKNLILFEIIDRDKRYDYLVMETYPIMCSISQHEHLNLVWNYLSKLLCSSVEQP